MRTSLSRVLPFLPLLMLLPATSSAFFLPIPVIKPTPNYAFHPSELCPLIHIVEHELCNSAALHHKQQNGSGSPIPELCALLQNYNTSFCSEKEKSKTEGMSNDDMSVIILQKEFHANMNKSDGKHDGKHDSDNHNDSHIHDIHKLCPILNFIDQELCTSRNPSVVADVKLEFDPKQLCPLLNLTYTEFCQ